MHARQIVAIMFTDLVGYSAWVQRNEAQALEMLKLHWALLRPVFARFEGREIKTIGDAFLIEFPSALQAVHAGIEMQAALEKHNRDAEKDRQIRIRIGIHTGDVERVGDDLFGDGVNIASRIETLAPPGGICISDSVYAAVQNKLDAPFYSLGTQRLKNIAQSVVVYCDQPVGRQGRVRQPMLAGAGALAAVLVAVLVIWKFSTSAGTGGEPAQAPVAAPAGQAAVAGVEAPAAAPQASTDRPRLAVLPLANFSPDPNNAFFADGLHDDILTALSRLRGVDVISRTTMETFRGSKSTLAEIATKLRASHVLEGSVRRDDVRVRLTVQLIDARTDDHVWAETYDRPLTDALALQSAVATEVAHALQVAIGAGASTTPPTTVPAAYDLYLKARVTSDAEDQLKLLDSALLLDPAFTLARAQRAIAATTALWVDGMRLVDLGPQTRADIDQARREQPDLPEVEVAEGYYAYRVLRDYGAALAIVDRVLARSADVAEGLALRAFLLRRIGRRDEALAAIDRALELEPENPVIAANVAELLIYYGNYREAIRLLDRAIASASPEAVDALKSTKITAEFELTGDLEPAFKWLETVRDHEPYKRYYYDSQGVTEERLNYYLSDGREWLSGGNSVVVPRTLVVAFIADALGKEAIAAQALKEAEQSYRTLAPVLMAMPEVRSVHAMLLALKGEHAAAIEEVERAIAAVPPGRDQPVASSIHYNAVLVMDRAGNRDRAIELLQSLVNEEVIDGVPMVMNGGADFYHDRTLAALLGDDPRYQALMQKIKSRFEPL